MLMNENDAKAICSRILGFVKAEDAVASVTSEEYSHLRFAANAFTTSGRSESGDVGVTVWIDKRRGSSTINATDDASLRAAVEEAEQIARISPVDREYLPTLGPQQYKPVNGYVDATVNLSPGARAKAVDDVITACEKAGVIGAGFHRASGSASASATKNGNFVYNRSSSVGLSVTARTREGDGSGYFLRSHFDIGKLDTARIARESIRKALDSRNPRTLDPGVYTVILEPQAVADLVSSLGGIFDARGADEGRNALAAAGGKTKLGERIFDERVNVLSDPWRPELPGSKSAQAGLPAERVYLVRNGVVENLVYSRFWAQQKGKTPTPGPVNTILESSAPPSTVDEMIAATDRGLLLGRFWYIRSVDPRTALVTGLTRDGVWYVEKGKVQYPVRNFRFNQSLLQLLAPGNVEMIGAPERVGGSEGGNASLRPALKVKEFNFTSLSEAV
jgi:predicted Zn-dependent protease